MIKCFLMVSIEVNRHGGSLGLLSVFLFYLLGGLRSSLNAFALLRRLFSPRGRRIYLTKGVMWLPSDLPWKSGTW